MSKGRWRTFRVWDGSPYCRILAASRVSLVPNPRKIWVVGGGTLYSAKKSETKPSTKPGNPSTLTSVKARDKPVGFMVRACFNRLFPQVFFLYFAGKSIESRLSFSRTSCSHVVFTCWNTCGCSTWSIFTTTLLHFDFYHTSIKMNWLHPSLFLMGLGLKPATFRAKVLVSKSLCSIFK